MPAWLIWLIAAVLLVVAEVFSLELVLIMFAMGAFAAAGAASLGAGLVVQSFVFAGVSILALVLVRPLVRPLLRRGRDKTPMGIEALEGAQALVLEPVDQFSGRVKIRGEEWTANSVQPGETLAAGETAIVIKIQGATALVRRQS